MDRSSENGGGEKPLGRKPAQAATTREGRLKAALKANMARRKSQARGRAEADEGGSGDGPDEGAGEDS
ncbi:hypothetical protein [Pseudogemmobacter bohemicus]|uniref:hypothetical protein n=1 Tax=Pseudogemmobacter bohemicus TaxID=2250708 RepID=UPI000DD2FA60|nr:hypothetical protein [Pseudogemmobacter bohemicus]